jgi:hypothetical protein
MENSLHVHIILHLLSAVDQTGHLIRSHTGIRMAIRAQIHHFLVEKIAETSTEQILAGLQNGQLLSAIESQ